MSQQTISAVALGLAVGAWVYALLSRAALATRIRALENPPPASFATCAIHGYVDPCAVCGRHASAVLPRPTTGAALIGRPAEGQLQ